MNKEQIINKLTALSKADVTADFSEKEHFNTQVIKVDNNIFIEAVKLIEDLSKDLKIKNETLIKLAIKGIKED